MKNILVTGGAGYIGANTVDALIKAKYSVIIVDNLSTGHKELIHKKAEFYKIDLLDKKKLIQIFNCNKIDAVLHFAGVSQVGESAKNPKKYTKNNILAGRNLLNVMAKAGCKKIIFSSSASVYGIPKHLPIDEKHPLNPVSFYGKTKKDFEKILQTFDKKHGVRHVTLRYFNAGGSGKNALLGEMHDPETHLIPTVFALAKKHKNIKIFGSDYDTKDGTCIRDYIHVTDLANAHLLALKYLQKNNKSQIINLGSGKGHSVFEIVKLCEKVLKTKLKIKMEKRRHGDPDILLASNKKAWKILKWKPKKTISDIIKSAWNFQS